MSRSNLLMLVLAAGLVAGSAGAAGAESCCRQAKKAAKSCEHKCCVEAAKKKKSCLKCNPKKEVALEKK